VVANAGVAPNADTTAPLTGLPRSSRTMPWIAPVAAAAMFPIGRRGACARTTTEVHRSTRPPTTADAANLDLPLMPPRFPGPGSPGLRRRHGEVNVPGQSLVRDFVGDFDLQPVIALGKRRQRHGLSGLQLIARGHVESRRQRLRVQVGRIRLVEELLAARLLLLYVVSCH